MKKIFLIAVLLGVQNIRAQYKAEPCKSKDFSGETCLVKEFQSDEVYTMQDIISLKSLVQKNPQLPWMKIIDSDGQLVTDLSSASYSISKAESKKFSDLLSQLKSNLDPQVALDAIAIYLKNNPSHPFYLNSKDKDLVEKIAKIAVLPNRSNKDSVSKTELNLPRNKNYKRCIPNQQKYQELMSDIDHCGGKEVQVENGRSLYTALAEIAACEDYNVDQIGVVEKVRTRGLVVESKPCVVSLKGASASIGAGVIDIKINGDVKSIQWVAGHDLTGKSNDLSYWRDQLIPQVQGLFKSGSEQANQSPAADSSGAGNKK